MKDKAERIDWYEVVQRARAAYAATSAVIDWNDFCEGYISGYKAAFEEYK